MRVADGSSHVRLVHQRLHSARRNGRPRVHRRALHVPVCSGTRRLHRRRQGVHDQSDGPHELRSLWPRLHRSPQRQRPHVVHRRRLRVSVDFLPARLGGLQRRPHRRLRDQPRWGGSLRCVCDRLSRDGAPVHFVGIDECVHDGLHRWCGADPLHDLVVLREPDFGFRELWILRSRVRRHVHEFAVRMPDRRRGLSCRPQSEQRLSDLRAGHEPESLDE